MKKSLALAVLLSSALATTLVGRRAQVEIRTSKLSPAQIKKWLDEYGVDYRFSVIDDDLIKDEDEGGIEDNVSMLHLIARTPIKNGQGRQKLLSLAQRVVSERPELVNDQQSGGFTPLHNAAYRGYQKMVDLFLKNGADLAIKDYKYKRTASDWAKTAGRTRTAAMLMKAQFDQAQTKPMMQQRMSSPRRLPGSPPPFIGTW